MAVQLLGGIWAKHPFPDPSSLLPVLSAPKSAFSSHHHSWIKTLWGRCSDSEFSISGSFSEQKASFLLFWEPRRAQNEDPKAEGGILVFQLSNGLSWYKLMSRPLGGVPAQPGQGNTARVGWDGDAGGGEAPQSPSPFTRGRGLSRGSSSSAAWGSLNHIGAGGEDLKGYGQILLSSSISLYSWCRHSRLPAIPRQPQDRMNAFLGWLCWG